jgi:hypothetical protein
LVLDSVGGDTSKPISLISEENDRRQSRSILISGRALGPKRLSNVSRYRELGSGSGRSMSALKRITDSGRTSREVRKVPH